MPTDYQVVHADTAELQLTARRRTHVPCGPPRRRRAAAASYATNNNSYAAAAADIAPLHRRAEPQRNPAEATQIGQCNCG
eukprot:SAG31_NODE_1606_length_7761_cov_4.493996_4_plen_80_part_00